MRKRMLALAAILPLALVAACDDITRTISSNPNAVVRFANASTGVINVTNADTLLADNTGLGYGGSTTCLTVSPSTPKLVFTDASTNAPIAFSPNFSQGRQYTVIAYKDATGATKFISIDDTFKVPTGQAGMNVFNGAAGSPKVVPVINGAAIGSGVSFGTASNYSAIPIGPQPVTFNTGTGTATLLDAGTLTFYDNVRSTIIVAPAASGTGYRAFAVTSC